MPRPVHFDMTAENPERAIAFYSGIFGWAFQKWEGPMEYWMIKSGESPEQGIDGGMGRRESPEQIGTTNVIGVTGIDSYLEKIAAGGGTVASPKSPIPGIGYLAYCVDTEGNTFGLMEFDASAA